MKKLLFVLFFLPAVALASGDAGYRLDRAPIDPKDLVSLQAGARTFVNYCLNCHGAQHLRYSRLQDLGLTEAQIKDNLMFTTEKIGDTMKISAPAKDSKHLRNVYSQIVKGVDMNHSYACSSCDYSAAIEVPLTTDFFWFK